MASFHGARGRSRQTEGRSALAREAEIPLLAQIPFDPRLSSLADEGRAIVEVEPHAQVSRAILGLAETVAAAKREQGIGIVKKLPLVSA